MSMAEFVFVWVLLGGLQKVNYFETKAQCKTVEKQLVKQGFYVTPCHKQIVPTWEMRG